jgi:hypothetical protein
LNNFIENHTGQLANGQVSCDLRDNSDATEPETQLDAVKTIEQRPDVAPEEFPAPIGKFLGLMITSSGAGRATVDFRNQRTIREFYGNTSWPLIQDASASAAT